MQLPYFVNEYINREIINNNQVRVEINEFSPDNKIVVNKFGLTFGIDRCFHGLNGEKITIDHYILNTLKYSRKNIKIYLNNKLLSDIKPLMLEAPSKTPPTINLNDTKG